MKIKETGKSKKETITRQVYFLKYSDTQKWQMGGDK